MAQFIPKGYKCSAAAAARLAEEMHWIGPLVRKRARRFFGLKAISQADLEQEGLLAATYGLDTFAQGRGKLKAYIGTVVENALAMVACESRAQKRHPYIYEHDGQEWQRVSAPEGADPDMCADATNVPEMQLMDAEERMAVIKRTSRSRDKVEVIRSRLTEPARRVLDVRMNPPPELMVLARNLTGRAVNPGSRIANRAVSAFLGISTYQVDRAIKEIKTAINDHKLGR